MGLADYAADYLLSSFRPAALGSSPGATEATNFLSENPNMSALAMAVGMQFADGDDGSFGSIFKTIIDYFAISDSLSDGDSNMLSKFWLGMRAYSIASEQTGSTMGALAAGAATMFGLGSVENQFFRPREAAPTPA